jgi:AraC-like DNA-binding protein
MISLDGRLGVEECDRLLDAIPASLTRIECVVVLGFLTRAAWQVHPTVRLPLRLPDTETVEKIGLWFRRVAAVGVTPSSSATWRLAALFVFVNGNFSNPRLGLRDAAEHVGLTRWRVAHLIKQSTGERFTDFLRRARIQEARRLLAECVLSVKEISIKVGFASTDQLDRNFKRDMGCTPSEFRRRVQAIAQYK